MKIIAHRNETPGCPENSIESLVYSAQEDIYAVECDVRHTKDGQFVIYHDENMKRLANDDRRIEDVTLDEMRAALAKAGRNVITLETLIADYPAKTPVLLHIKERKPTPEFVDILRNSRIEFIFGVECLEMLAALREFTPKDHLLAFMPSMEMYPEFIAGGIGIIRLWEHWLDKVTPDMVHAAGAEQVWIMCNTPEHALDGTPESLDYFLTINVDGALVSDMVMARAWIDSHK